MEKGYLLTEDGPSFHNMVKIPEGMLNPVTRRVKLTKIDLHGKHPRTFTRHEVKKYVSQVAKQMNHPHSNIDIKNEQETADILDAGNHFLSK